MIVPSLQDVDRCIVQSTQIDHLTRALLVYFEILNIHPFSDGNGRVGRIVLTRMLSDYLDTTVPIDLTLVMRSDFRRFNGMLEKGRSPETYREWLYLFHGLLATELLQVSRVWDSLAALDKSSRENLLEIINEALEKIRSLQDVDIYLAKVFTRHDLLQTRILGALLS